MFICFLLKEISFFLPCQTENPFSFCSGYLGLSTNKCWPAVIPLELADSRNGGSEAAFCHTFLRYFSVETLCIMFIVHPIILNGYIEFKTSENDYVGTLHEGTTQGLRLLSTSCAWCEFRNSKFICRFSSFLQGAKVWVPHHQVVWIGGELTKDLKEDGVLEIELEDGNVSC